MNEKAMFFFQMCTKQQLEINSFSVLTYQPKKPLDFHWLSRRRLATSQVKFLVQYICSAWSTSKMLPEANVIFIPGKMYLSDGSTTSKAEKPHFSFLSFPHPQGVKYGKGYERWHLFERLHLASHNIIDHSWDECLSESRTGFCLLCWETQDGLGALEGKLLPIWHRLQLHCVTPVLPQTVQLHRVRVLHTQTCTHTHCWDGNTATIKTSQDEPLLYHNVLNSSRAVDIYWSIY